MARTAAIKDGKALQGDVSHDQKSLYWDYMGILQGPSLRATRLCINNFDHGSHAEEQDKDQEGLAALLASAPLPRAAQNRGARQGVDCIAILSVSALLGTQTTSCQLLIPSYSPQTADKNRTNQDRPTATT